MELNFEKTNDHKGVITIGVCAEDYADKVTEKLKEIGRTRTIPGFRKGHITIAELRKRFGSYVKSEAINEVVIDKVFDYIKSNDLRIIGQPVPNDNKAIDLKATDYSFSYDVALWPEVDYCLDKTVELPFYEIEVTPAMIEEAKQDNRSRMAKSVKADVVDDTALVKGSIREVNGGENAIEVSDGIVYPASFRDEAAKAAFAAKHVGDVVTFNPFKAEDGNAVRIATTLHIDQSEVARADADFEMTISEIMVRQEPEENQEFYDSICGADKVHNAEEYSEFVKQSIAAQMRPDAFLLSNKNIHDYLMATYGDKVVINDDVVKRWISRQEEKPLDEIEKDYDSIRTAVQWEIIQADITRLFDIKITEEDVANRAKDHARQHLARYGMYDVTDEIAADVAKTILQDKQSRGQIIRELESTMIFNVIRHKITMKPQVVTFEKFKDLAEGKE